MESGPFVLFVPIFFLSVLSSFLLERPGQSVCVRLMGNARTYATRNTTGITGLDREPGMGKGGHWMMMMMMRVSWPPGSSCTVFCFGDCQRWDEGAGWVE